MGRSPAIAKDAGASTLSLGLWQASMSLETSRRVVSSTLRRAGLCGHAERVDISGSVPADLSDHGSDSGLHSNLERARLVTAAQRLPVHQCAASPLLLRVAFGRRLLRRLFCFA